MSNAEDYDEDDWGRVPPRRFQAIDLIGIGAQMVSDLLESVASAAHSVGDLIAAHSNYREDRQEFAETAALEIERLIEGGDS